MRTPYPTFGSGRGFRHPGPRYCSPQRASVRQGGLSALSEMHVTRGRPTRDFGTTMPFSSEVVSEWRVIRTELLNAARLIVTYLAANGRCRRCSPSLAAGTAAILLRRTSKAGTGRAEYIEQREGIYRLSRRSGLQIHLFSSH